MKRVSILEEKAKMSGLKCKKRKINKNIFLYFKINLFRLLNW